MRIQQNKTIVTIALILMLPASILTACPIVNAQEGTIPTHAFVSVAPNPIGVNQQVFISMWLIEINPLTYSNMPSGTYSPEQYLWQGFQILVTRPDGSTETLGPFASTAMSMLGVAYTPTQIGTYNLKFSFPGQQVSGFSAYPVNHTVNARYGPSSATTSLTVQQAPLTPLPQTPLPTGYWQRPIDWQNQQWTSISGNWFNTVQWTCSVATTNKDTVPPQSAHVVWTKSTSGPNAFGGQIGGSQYTATDLSNYYTGKTYEYYFNTLIIINGVLFYNSPTAIAPKRGFYAVDLRTGETLWYNNGTNQPPMNPYTSGGFALPINYYPGISYGEVFTHHNPNEVGGLAYLWGVSGTTWSMYDASTGNWILNIANSTGGFAITDPSGQLLVYTLNAARGWLAMWNSTKCVGAKVDPINGWFWRPPAGETLNWRTGIEWNVTVPTKTAPNQYTAQNLTEAIVMINNGVILATTGNTGTPQDYQWEVGYSATNGDFLWAEQRSAAQEPGQTSWGLMGPAVNGVYVEFNKATKQFFGFSITTGKQLWGPSEPLPTAEASYTYIYAVTDKLFVAQGLTGLYAYNFADGTKAWSWTSPPAGLQSAWPTYPLEGQTPGCFAAGDMIFVAGSNSHGDQLFRGAELYAVNANNGQLVWSVDGFMIGMGAADGYLVAFNAYENQIYCFGKGLTATTVTAPNVGVPQGTSVLMQGTVTDQSPGETCLGIPAAGTPAISDDIMSDWMAYLYMQQPKPNNAVGVKVRLTATDSSGKTWDIGTTTSNDLGNYAIPWTPSAVGVYTVKASFDGSKSYYESQAGTSLVVSEAAPTQTVSTEASWQETALLILGIIILIAIVVVAVLVLRKK